MKNGPWYCTPIFSQLSGHNFEDYFISGCKDKYELLCAVNVYGILNCSGYDYASSDGDISL